jgi:polyvinyl alcohol dehydrogenase (cytochrome)
MRLVRVDLLAGLSPLFVAFALPALSQAPATPGQSTGAAVFQRECASCHAQPAADSRAPSREALRQFVTEGIVDALTNGSMRIQGEKLTETERRAVAEFLTDRSAAPAATVITIGRCPTTSPMGDPGTGPRWNGWGAGVTNARYQPEDVGGLTAADVPKLKLKWAFGLPDVVAARAQPTVVAGRLFTASEKGDIFALDAKTGCLYWIFRAQAGVRTAITVAPYKSATSATRYALYFGDSRANAYAIDAETGEEIWVRKLDEHPGATMTGAPTLFDGRLYVPIAGIGEEGQGGRSNYQCCTFRGSVSALDATTGAVVWKTYSIAEEPKPRAKNKDGVQTWGPAGGGIWGAPTIDVRRGAVYVATGNGYADPPQRTTDAVLALDIKTGKIRWVNQATPNDVWMMGCKPENADNPNCPEKLGPDHDFSASPVLAKTTTGRELLVIPQKSGMAYALDPDKDGAIVWQYRIGQGSGLGGQWGAAVDGQQAYFGVADFLTPNPGGMQAVKLDTGEKVWFTPPQPKLCGTAQRCSAAQGGAVTVIPGAVFSASADGGIRAYSTKDGSIIWTFDTNRTFETVNGVRANGGTMDGPGPVVIGGMMYVNSGYGGFVARPGNVLLAFGID